MSASTKRNSKKRLSGTQDEGMGSLVPITAFSDGCQGESIEHSLMDMRRGKSQICQCFAASTEVSEQNSKLQANRNEQVNEDDWALHMMISHRRGITLDDRSQACWPAAYNDMYVNH